MNQEINNIAKIAGTVVSEPQLYDCSGERFYSFHIAAKRESGNEDVLPVNLSRNLAKTINKGDKLQLVCQVRTYNKTVNGKNKLVIVLFVLQVEPYVKDINEVELTGFICKKPVPRATPLGKDICDLLLAVPRLRGKTDYIPCIAWSKNAAYVGKLDKGAEVWAQGRMQSRNYQKAQADGSVATLTAYEVSVSRITEVEA